MKRICVLLVSASIAFSPYTSHKLLHFKLSSNSLYQQYAPIFLTHTYIGICLAWLVSLAPYKARYKHFTLLPSQNETFQEPNIHQLKIIIFLHNTCTNRNVLPS